MRVALVEDDASLRMVVAHYLELHGMQVHEIGNATELLALLAVESVDAVLLDLNLPDEDGLVVLRMLRARTPVPVMVVSARNDEASRVAAFEVGADDFIIKPFSPRELLLRLERLVKRQQSTPFAVHARRYRVGGHVIDLSGRAVHDEAGVPIRLTPAEFDLLAALVLEQSGTVSRERLADAVAGGVDGGNPESVTVLVHRLRRKLEPSTGGDPFIVTVPRHGYRLAHPVEPVD